MPAFGWTLNKNISKLDANLLFSNTMCENPLISVIIPLYNKEHCVKQTILSVLNQTYEKFELIVVDDGSTDNSYEEVKSIKDDRIKLIRKENGGVSAARNYGVDYSIGEWILFLDADDILFPNCIESLYNTAFKYKTLAVTGNFYIESVTKQIKDIGVVNNKEGIIKCNFYAWNVKKICPRTGAALFRRNILLEFPNNIQLRRFEDAEFLFNIMRKYTFSFTPVCVMSYIQDYNHLSTLKTNIYEDFISCIVLEGKTFWEKVALSDLIIHGYKSYPNEKEFLNMRYSKYKSLLMFNKIFFRVWRKMVKIAYKYSIK